MTQIYKYLLSDLSNYSTFIVKTRLITQYSPRYSTRYLTRDRVTRPRFFNFAIRLRLDLGYKALIFASTTNLESVPRFADICSTYSIFRQWLYFWTVCDDVIWNLNIGKIPVSYIIAQLSIGYGINVTSFSSISYWSNSIGLKNVLRVGTSIP